MIPANVDEPAKPQRTWSDWLRTARRWSGWMLAAYAVAQFTGTHLPNPPSLVEIEGNDKFLHWGAYFGLAFLSATWWSTRAEVTRLKQVLLWCAIAVLAALDEITQLIPGVNRQADAADWIADVIGAACGLLIWNCLRPTLSPTDTTNKNDERFVKP